MKKYALPLGLSLLLAALIFFSPRDTAKAPPETPDRRSADFSAVGTIEAQSPATGQATLYISYPDKEGAARKKLSIDALSVCGGPSGALPCLAMSVTWDVPFGGKRAFVEGVAEEEGVLLRKLWVLEEGHPFYQMTGLVPKDGPGDVFVAWPEAVRMIQDCEAEMVTQSHQLDVRIKLSDESWVRAVEPRIDEVFRITDGVSEKCGTFPVATE